MAAQAPVPGAKNPLSQRIQRGQMPMAQLRPRQPVKLPRKKVRVGG